jgi:serine/threonine protein kinase
MDFGVPLDEDLWQRLPLPLAQLYRRAHNARAALDRHLAAFYLWEACLKLLGSVAVVCYAEHGQPDPQLAVRLHSLARPTPGHWWELVRLLTTALAEQGDEGFQGLRRFLYGRARDDLPRTAGLEAVLGEVLEGRAGARATVSVAQLFERLIRYRNQEIGHGAAGQRAGDYYERMGGAILAGVGEILRHLDALAGRRLLYVAEVRQAGDGWRVERYELTGEVPRRREALQLPAQSAPRLPTAGRVYLLGPDGPASGGASDAAGLVSLHPLVTFDEEANEFFFLNARRGRRQTEYLCYTTGRTVSRPDLGPEQRELLARVLGMELSEEAVATWAAQEASEAEAAPPPEESRRTLGEFELLGEVGRGGMAVVYRAWQPSLGRQVALKCLHRMGDPRAEARFAREIRALGRVEHPNLVKVYTSGADGERWFYAMEFLEGATLAEVCRVLGRPPAGGQDPIPVQEMIAEACRATRAAERPLDGTEGQQPSQGLALGHRWDARAPAGDDPARGGYHRWAVSLIRQAAQALHALHEAGVVHRDVKPGSIMVSPDGAQAVLFDAGVALMLEQERAGRLTQTREFIGTLRYASPEQVVDAHRIDGRSDVYSLGATLWELLTLRLLYGATDETPTPELVQKIHQEYPERPRKYDPGISRVLEAIVLRCLEKDPARRYQTAAELADDLGRWLAGEPVRALPVTFGYLARRFLRRHQTSLIIAATLAGVLIVGNALLLYTWGSRLSGAGTRGSQAEIDALREEVRAYRTSMRARFLPQVVAAQGLATPGAAAAETASACAALGVLEYGTFGRGDLLPWERAAYEAHIRALEEEVRTNQERPEGPGNGWGTSLGWVAAGMLLCVLVGTTVLTRALRRKPFTLPPEAKPPAKEEGPAPREEERGEAPPPQDEAPPRPVAQEAFSRHTVVLHYPAPIAIAFRRFCRRTEARDRLAQLFDTFEITLKYLTYLGLCDLLGCMARSRRDKVALPKHQAFEFTRRPWRMTVGRWVEALRQTCVELDRFPDRFLKELPDACGPQSYADRVVFSWIAAERNAATHRRGGLSLHSEKCPPLIDQALPLLLRLFEDVAFVRRYPLGFLGSGERLGGDSDLVRYRAHSCMGPHVATFEQARPFDSSLPLKEDVPFVVTPDGPTLHYLWPLLLERESDAAQRPTLYVFEEIPEDAKYLGRVCVAAIDQETETWTVPTGEEHDDHDWLLEKLRTEYAPVALALPRDSRLRSLLEHPLVGIGDLSGERLGPNTLLRPIARGGFGTIYDARAADGRQVAVKVIEEVRERRQLRELEEEFRRLREVGEKLERDRAAGKKVPGIIRCFATGRDVKGNCEFPWYSMEFAAGGDLYDRLEERKAAAGDRLVWEDSKLRGEVVAEFRAIAEAVAYLHDEGILHRDIKPENVLIMEGGGLRLSDFGLARVLDEDGESSRSRRRTVSGRGSTRGSKEGTRFYRAPEQERGRRADKKTVDVYALGIVLAELALGDLPEPDLAVAAGSTVEHDRRLERLPDRLRRLIVDCTDLDPSRRPPHAHDVLHQFELAVRDEVA